MHTDLGLKIGMRWLTSIRYFHGVHFCSHPVYIITRTTSLHVILQCFDSKVKF